MAVHGLIIQAFGAAKGGPCVSDFDLRVDPFAIACFYEAKCLTRSFQIELL